MKTEKGVIIIAYKESRRNNRFALLQRKKNWEGWELPKGHLEEEDYEHTVNLELKEEAGIEEENIQKVIDMEETVEWEFEDGGEKIKREYRAFLVRVDHETRVDVSGNPHDEHVQGFFLKEEDAKSLLTYENNVEMLEKGIEKISEN